MQRGHEQWPHTRWELSAPASYVLMNGAEASGAEAFKLALLDLVTRGALRLTQLERRRAFVLTEQVSALAQGSKAVPTEASELRAVHELYRSRADKDGTEAVPVEALAKTAKAHYGSIGKYTHREVLPALVSRGMYRAESYRVLFIFPSTRYVLTEEGTAARAELMRQMVIARQRLPGWVAGDLARAVAFVALAGASLLLVSELYPDLQQLHRELERQQAGDSGSSSSDAGSSSGGGTTSDSDWGHEPGPEGEQGDFAFGGLDLSAVAFDFDFGAFESIGEAFSSIDAGVDSGGDGGGDGGDGGGNGGGNGGGGD